MRKFILFPVLIATAIVVSGGCSVDFAEAEESRLPEFEETIEETVEEEVEENVYWDEIPLAPLGYRDVETDIPDEIWSAAVIWGAEYHIAPEFLCAIAYRESRYQNVKDATGKYWGVCQIHPGSHSKRLERLGLTKDDLMNVSSNIRVAADYLNELFDEWEDPAIVLMCYRGEPSSNIAGFETTGRMSSYASFILDYSAGLERAHGR